MNFDQIQHFMQTNSVAGLATVLALALLAATIATYLGIAVLRRAATRHLLPKRVVEAMIRPGAAAVYLLSIDAALTWTSGDLPLIRID